MGTRGAWRVNRFNAYLRLARVSNLPTVWSNVLAGSAIAGGLEGYGLIVAMLAASLLYTAGMFLNDAFDREIDAVERPGRPLSSGAVAPSTVWSAGIGMLIAGAVLFATFGLKAAAAGAVLAVSIILYDAWHKGNSIAPFIMGLCRALVYIATAAAAGSVFSMPLLSAALALLAYVAGLTFAAKEESFDRVQAWWPLVLLALPLIRGLALGWSDLPTLLLVVVTTAAIAVALRWLKRRSPGDVGRAVSLLIAAIALTDAVAAATAGNTGVAIICCGLFLLTLLFQRVIPGT